MILRGTDDRSEQLGDQARAGRPDDDAPVMQVQSLSVAYEGSDGQSNTVVWELDLALRKRRISGLAGESGCGKSTAALAAIGYPMPNMQVLGGRSLLGDVDLLSLDFTSLQSIWGRRVAYVSQQATTALTPGMTVGRQLAQPLKVHLGLRGAELRKRQVQLMEMVRIPDAERALSRYPFQFSGGQQQRIAIAIGLSCGPDVLILDEPTTGLDVTTQAQISSLLLSLLEETGCAALYVSHDLALLNELADDLTVMYAGQVAERGETKAVVSQPRHPYTRELLRAVPDVRRPGRIAGIPGAPPSGVVIDRCSYAPRCPLAIEVCTSGPVELFELDDGHVVRCLRAEETIAAAKPISALPRGTGTVEMLEVSELRCEYPGAPQPVVKDVNLIVRAGETLGIVGESGSGKSTLLRAIAGLHPPAAGTIRFEGVALEPQAIHRPREIRHKLQLIFQNPDSSLNPRQTIANIVGRPIRLFRDDVPRQRERQVVGELLDAVKLSRSVLDRYPSQLSGGQKQRVAIARAFAAEPAALLCDEITSALDVSVQATVLELLAGLAAETGTAIVFVAHDLAVVRAIATYTIVMRDGEVCEQGPTDALFASPQHPYTQSLLAAIAELPPAA